MPEIAPPPANRILDRALLIGFLGVVLAFSAFDVYNYDVPIYLRKGLWTLEHGEIPTPDRFLFADFKESIRGKEKWLFQLAVVVAHKALGWLGLVLFRMGVLLPAFFFVYLLGRGPDRSGSVWAGLVGLVALVCAHERFDVRPELPSILYTAASLFLLTRDRTARDRWVWATAGIQVLWVNMHSSHPIGLGLVGFAFAGAIVRAFLARHGPAAADERAYVVRIAKVLAAVALACFVSPAPIGNAWYPFDLFLHLYRKAPWFSEAIYEILPPFHAPELFPTWALAAYRILLVVSCLSFVVNARRVDPFHLIAHVAFLVYSLSMRRNLSYFAVVCAPIAAWNLSAALSDGAGRRLRPFAAMVFAVAGVWLAAVVLGNGFYQADRSTRRTGLGLSELAYPLAADRWLAGRGVRGNVFTNWDAGSWLAFTSFPERVPFMHSEGDYNMDLFDAYRKTMSGRLDYRDVVARYDVQAFLLRHTAGDVRPFVARLAKDPAWSLAFADATAGVWLKAGTAPALVLPTEAEVRKAEPRLAGEPAPSAGEEYGAESALGDRGAAFDRARAALNLGSFYGALGRADLEAAQYLVSIDALPGLPEAHNNLGACFAQSGLVAPAERELRRALALKEDYPSAHRNLGLLLAARAFREEDRSEALGHLERAVALNPKEVAAHLDLARGLTGFDELERAAAVLETASTLDPDDPRADTVLLELYREGLRDSARAEAVRRRMEERGK